MLFVLRQIGAVGSPLPTSSDRKNIKVSVFYYLPDGKSGKASSLALHRDQSVHGDSKNVKIELQVKLCRVSLAGLPSKGYPEDNIIGDYAP